WLPEERAGGPLARVPPRARPPARLNTLRIEGARRRRRIAQAQTESGGLASGSAHDRCELRPAKPAGESTDDARATFDFDKALPHRLAERELAEIHAIERLGVGGHERVGPKIRVVQAHRCLIGFEYQPVASAFRNAELEAGNHAAIGQLFA